MTARLIIGAVMAAAVMGGAVVFAPASHATPQCRYGKNVTADCTSGQCPEVTTAQATPCLGMVLDPLFPPGPPVKVGLEGGFGIG